MGSRSQAASVQERVAPGIAGARRGRHCRIALYSHDTMGIGHMRRNLLIATALTHSSLRPSILLIAGAREASAFPMPIGVDCLTLPAYRKETDGRYQSRSLDLPLDQLVRLRAGTIATALEAFEPDVLIVDKVARGAFAELDPALASLRAKGRTRCVLGLRDVLDDPDAVRREWDAAGEEESIRTYYDAVWVYGDPAVYDLVRECRLRSDVAARVVYTGYLDQRPRRGYRQPSAAQPSRRLVLGMVGGGQDGAPLAEAFAYAPLPPQTRAVLLTGPFMPRSVCRRLHRRAHEQRALRVVRFVPETADLLRRADRIIAMGGYNTVCEVLSHEKHALIVPRVAPRREQLIRAERLRDLGLLDLLHPEQASAQAIGDWLAQDPRSLPPVREQLDLNGLARLPQLVQGLRGAGAPDRKVWGRLPASLPRQAGSLPHRE